MKSELHSNPATITENGVTEFPQMRLIRNIFTYRGSLPNTNDLLLCDEDNPDTRIDLGNGRNPKGVWEPKDSEGKPLIVRRVRIFGLNPGDALVVSWETL